MSKTAESRAAEVSRRGKANKLNGAAEAYYREHWDVHNLADIEEDAGEFDHKGAKGTLPILEYAGYDVLIDTHTAQYAVQEKVVYPNTRGNKLLIRMNNGSENVASEAKKLRKLGDSDKISPGLMPTHIGFGKARDWGTFEWFVLIDVPTFAELWDDEVVTPVDIYRNEQDGTESLMFRPEDIPEECIVAQWGDR